VFRERLFAMPQDSHERPFVVKPQFERTSGERVFLPHGPGEGTMTNICTAPEVSHA